ncbi:MAG TPA: hydroxymethylbilane synthase [Ilumatobacteraceae bacterium]|nr:hydroxymethylbilane synthase [Ilumatobacteraceae bacterium]
MHGDRPLRLATRGSAQARTQAQSVADALMAAHPGRVVELVFVETLGDRTQHADIPLHTIGGQGVFVKEVQSAVLRGDADIAAHSAKDLPSVTADGLQLAAFCQRRDARDVLVGATLDGLPHGAAVATGSVRRRAQLTVARPDLHFLELRGNIHTRLGKVPEGGAIVMAAAALDILGLLDQIADYLPPATFVPSPGQGCVAIECRADDDAMADVLATIDHATSRRAVEIERAFLAELGSGCSLPVGAHATGTTLTAFLGAATGAAHLIETVELPDQHDEALERAAELARSMRDRVQ